MKGSFIACNIPNPCIFMSEKDSFFLNWAQNRKPKALNLKIDYL